MARGVTWCVSRKAARGQVLDETNKVYTMLALANFYIARMEFACL